MLPRKAAHQPVTAAWSASQYLARFGRDKTNLLSGVSIRSALAPVRDWVGRQEGWGRGELAAAHDAMVTAPGELSELLLRIG